MPVGPTGCNASKPDTEERNTAGFMIALMHGHSWSHVHFSDGTEPLMEQQVLAGTFGYFFSNGWSIGASGGVIYAGELTGDAKDLVFGPGWMVSLRVAWQFLKQKGARPFMIASLNATVTRSKSTDHLGNEGHTLGTDFRFGLTTGWTIADVLQLYISPRFFGGPIFIEEDGKRLQGRDRYFFQLGLGASLLLPAGFTLFFDGSPGPEQSLSGGLAFSF